MFSTIVAFHLQNTASSALIGSFKVLSIITSTQLTNVGPSAYLSKPNVRRLPNVDKSNSETVTRLPSDSLIFERTQCMKRCALFRAARHANGGATTRVISAALKGSLWFIMTCNICSVDEISLLHFWQCEMSIQPNDQHRPHWGCTKFRHRPGIWPFLQWPKHMLWSAQIWGLAWGFFKYLNRKQHLLPWSDVFAWKSGLWKIWPTDSTRGKSSTFPCQLQAPHVAMTAR